MQMSLRRPVVGTTFDGVEEGYARHTTAASHAEQSCMAAHHGDSDEPSKPGNCANDITKLTRMLLHDAGSNQMRFSNARRGVHTQNFTKRRGGAVLMDAIVASSERRLT
jgi:hypothetical protein